MPKPDKNDLEKLYQAALKFEQTAPWMWMEGEDLFAVENPAGGESGYCSILGHSRETFGLSVLLGDRGYARHLEIISSEDAAEDPEASLMTPTLLLFLGSRRELEEKDLEIIRSLGLRFRGQNAWPMFRSLRPGFAPWFLEKEEAVYFAAVIEQALMVAEKVKQGGLDLLAGLAKGRVFTRLFRAGEWQEEWREPPPPPRDASTGLDLAGPVDEAELLLLRNSAGRLSGSWEVDLFLLPASVGTESQRPYYPLCFLIVDRKRGLILNLEVFEPRLTLSEKRGTFLQLLKKTGSLPENIWVKSARIRAILEPLAIGLGIKLRVGPLPFLEEARAGLQDHFAQGGPQRR